MWASAPTNGIAVSTVDGVPTPRRIRRSPERNAPDSGGYVIRPYVGGTEDL